MFDFLIKWKIDSALKNNSREHTLRNLENIESILILFSYDDWREVSQIASDLERRGKKVVLWTVHPLKKDTTNTIFPMNVKVIRHNETSLLQILSAAVLREFKNLSYDTLIDLTTTHNKVLKYLLAQNTSDFCIGISEPEEKIYDFIVLKDEDRTLQETYDQIKFYLNNVC